MKGHLFDLTGRTALGTGSSRGLGRAMAEGFGEAGAVVVLNGADAGRLASAVSEMRAAGHRAYEAASTSPVRWRSLPRTASKPKRLVQAIC
jgi:NAD(P)-dependent dehydrogenase (short-subunit alcohol dehydrogenase family)